MEEEYEVIIIGAGISGVALTYVLTKYSNITKIALVEKENKVAQINSNTYSNSQTLHFGDIETNYKFEKAKKVKRAADLVKNYVLKNDRKKETYSKYHKMVLAVGKEQVSDLDKRYEEFKTLFPSLKKIGRKELAILEPNVLKGRSESEALLALYSEDGYTIDYQKLSESFLENARKENKNLEIYLGEKVTNIWDESSIWRVKTANRMLSARILIVCAGAHSLLMAKRLGYGIDYSLLSVAGSFYFAPNMLNGKVYTMQIDKLPFAAIHGDPEVHDKKKTRFGPTAKVLPMLERHRYKTIYEYFKSAGIDLATLKSFAKILSDKTLASYMATQFLYDLPVIGKKLFIKEVKKIVPTINLPDLKKAKGYGGVRPQIVNKKTRSLDMGEAKIIGEKAIFNITPSPGASTCLKNAEDDAKKIVEWLGSKYIFDNKRFKKDLED